MEREIITVTTDTPPKNFLGDINFYVKTGRDMFLLVSRQFDIKNCSPINIVKEGLETYFDLIDPHDQFNYNQQQEFEKILAAIGEVFRYRFFGGTYGLKIDSSSDIEILKLVLEHVESNISKK